MSKDPFPERKDMSADKLPDSYVGAFFDIDHHTIDLKKRIVELEAERSKEKLS